MSTRLGRRVNPEFVAEHLQVEYLPSEHEVRLDGVGSNEALLVLLLEACSEEAVAWANAFASAQAGEMTRLIQNRLTMTEEALASAHAALVALQQELGLSDLDKELSEFARQRLDLESKKENTRVKLDTLTVEIGSLLQEIVRHHPALLAARQELNRTLLRYTEEHPKVQELKATLARLEARIAGQSNEVDPEIALHGSSLAQELYSQVIELRTRRAALEKELEVLSGLSAQMDAKLRELPGEQPEFHRREAQYRTLKTSRDFLIQRQAEAAVLQNQADTTFRVLEPVRIVSPSLSSRWQDTLALGAGAGALGLVLAWLCFGVVERRDHRISSPRDLKQATQLPLLATLQDLRLMTEQQKKKWAFDTLTTLKGELCRSPKEALVCGFVSAGHGEGRSTWINLLAEAAQQRGYRVLTIFPGPAEPKTPHPESQWALAPQPVVSPTDLMGVLADSVGPHRLDVYSADWAWNLQCREEWQAAVENCRRMENLVVFVELPPALEPESLLLSENLSQLIWLCGKDMAGVAETQKHIEMFKHARAELVGAVLNTPPRATRRIPTRGLASWMLLFLALAVGRAPAQETNTPASPADPTQEKPGGAITISSPAQIADWQKRLTLGPGDVLSISIYAQPDTLKRDLIIGPDGKLNYLQAQDVVADGLTVDELRGHLEEVLTQFYRPPIRVIIIPQAYNSKKYYLLGNVNRRGVFPLNQPLTIMEAIARAGGFVAASQRRNTLMVADLTRSFLVRKGIDGNFERVGVNFEDLFLRGDLKQNVGLAPDDYLYFPPLDLNEIYVLGAVGRPGVAIYTPEMTVLRAIVSQGGFRDKAYRSRVLVVRGSLNQPQPFVVNLNDVLKARSADFKLEPRDIVYVSRRPWAKAEELLEYAISEFLRAAVVSWTGQNVGPWITDPIIK